MLLLQPACEPGSHFFPLAIGERAEIPVPRGVDEHRSVPGLSAGVRSTASAPGGKFTAELAGQARFVEAEDPGEEARSPDAAKTAVDCEERCPGHTGEGRPQKRAAMGPDGVWLDRFHQLVFVLGSETKDGSRSCRLGKRADESENESKWPSWRMQAERIHMSPAHARPAVQTLRYVSALLL